MADPKITILTKAEKAAELRTSTDTIEKLAASGRLRKIQISTRRVGFVAGEVPAEPRSG
jgi:hypothetical protein